MCVVCVCGWGEVGGKNLRYFLDTHIHHLCKPTHTHTYIYLQSTAMSESTMSSSLCSNILNIVQKNDAESRIASVARLADGVGTLIRVNSGKSSSAEVTTSALRSALPLASVSSIENVVTGTCETQVLVPSPEEQRRRAWDLAKSEFRVFKVCLRAVFALLVLLFFGGCVAAIASSTAKQEL